MLENKEGRKCSVCHQTKLARYFPKTTHSTGMLAQAHICLSCQAALASGDTGDEGGSGGKQLQHVRDAKSLQRAMELQDALQKQLSDLATQEQNNHLFQTSQDHEGEGKTQTAQRDWLDQKEEESKASQDDDEPNSEVSLNTQVKKKNIVRLFSVTRSLALNRLAAANNKETTAKKNFGLFSKTSEQQLATKSAQQSDSKEVKQKLTEKALLKEDKAIFFAEQAELLTEQADLAENNETLAATDKTTLTAESSTLFSHTNATKSSTENTEKLTNAIKDGQKIFRW